MQRRFLLNIIFRQVPVVLELFAGEDEALLVRRDAFLVLDLGLDVLDRVAALHLQCDRAAGQRLHEDLHFNY